MRTSWHGMSTSVGLRLLDFIHHGVTQGHTEFFKVLRADYKNRNFVELRVLRGAKKEFHKEKISVELCVTLW